MLDHGALSAKMPDRRRLFVQILRGWAGERGGAGGRVCRSGAQAHVDGEDDAAAREPHVCGARRRVARGVTPLAGLSAPAGQPGSVFWPLQAETQRAAFPMVHQVTWAVGRAGKGGAYRKGGEERTGLRLRGLIGGDGVEQRDLRRRRIAMS